jgi:hypothetical protein
LIPQIPNDKKTYAVDEIFNSIMAKAIYKDIMDSRKYVGEDYFTYDTIERVSGEKTYVISARHIRISETMSYAKPSCNKCYGTGKKVMCIEKKNINNTEDYIILASVSLKGLTEEQKMAVIEEEKKGKFWTVLFPCPCTTKSMLKIYKNIVANELRNIVLEVICEEKVII